MNWLELLNELKFIVIIPLVSAASIYAIYWINVKCNELKSSMNNGQSAMYIDMLNDTIVNCVLATTQTYVEALKKDNAFTKEAQEEALRKTYDNVMKIVTEDMKECLTKSIGDLEAYIYNKIEAEVKRTKGM